MRQEQNPKRQTKVTTNPFITLLRRISQIFGGTSCYSYFCGRKIELLKEK